MKITFRQIDAFRAVVSSGSVTNAAELLGVSQPAISRLISDLESEVGFALFHREGRSLVPTHEGRLLVGEVRQAVSGMEHIAQTAKSLAEFGHLPLRLVTTPSFSNALAPDLLAEFAALRPKTSFHMEIEANDDTVEWLVSQNYDFGLSTSRPSNPSLEHLVLQEGTVFCLMSKDHALASKQRISPSDLSNESFVSYMPGSHSRFEIDRLFDDAGVSREMRYETRTTDAICEFVRRGLGVSLVSAINPTQIWDDLVAIPFNSDLTYRAVLIWPGNRALPAAGQKFLEMAQSRATRT